MNDQPVKPVVSPQADRAAELYLDLLKKTLTRLLFEGHLGLLRPVAADGTRFDRWLLERARRKRQDPMLQIGTPAVFDAEKRRTGSDWIPDAETMIGLLRLDNIQHCITEALRDGVEGDVIETGVWRGGATIFMRGVLKAFGQDHRRVFVADSFEGLPKPNDERYPADAGDTHWAHPELAVGVDEVKRNFQRYGLLDSQVDFLVGWFSDTLPKAPIKKLAVARLDGDMYESTMDALTHLYPKLSPGGFIIIDDFGAVPGCRKAVTDYREAHGIDEPLQEIDWTGKFWRKRFDSATASIRDQK